MHVGAMRGLVISRRLVAFLAAGVLGLALPLASVAVAYNDADNLPCKWPNASSIVVQYHWGSSINVSGNWANAFRLGNDRWNGAGTKVSLFYSSSSQATADVYSAADGATGKTQPICRIGTIGEMASFNSYGNVLYNPDATGDYLEMQRTAVHEFGHGLGLGHSFDTNAVMYRSNLGLYPNADDIAGINSLYP